MKALFIVGLVAALSQVPFDAKALSQLGDFVWLDANTNGLQDIGEGGFTNAGVRLYDASTNQLDVVLTDTNGHFSFTGLSAGTYLLGFVQPIGFKFTLQNVGTNIFIDSDAAVVGLTQAIVLGDNETNMTWDAGVARLNPDFSFTKIAATAPQGGIYYATQSEVVAYYYIVTNTGDTYLGMDLTDYVDDFNTIVYSASVRYPDCIAPGETRVFTNYVTINASVTNVAEVCAFATTFKCDPYPGLDSICKVDDAIVLICPDPTITPPSNQVVECTADLSTNALGSITISDAICDCVITNLTYTNNIAPGACPQSYTISRVFFMQDDCGHFGTATQIITVVDTIPPVLVGVPSNVAAECSSIPPPPVVSATDNCATNPLAPALVTTTNNMICENGYTLVRVWTVYDDCGNQAVPATQLVFVVDTTPPVLIGVPASTNVSCDSLPATPVVTAVDNCSTSPVTVQSFVTYVTGVCVNTYSLERRWSATDLCGNSVAATQIVNVSDTAAPLIVTFPSNRLLNCLTAIPPPDLPSFAAIDNCTVLTNLILSITTNDNGRTGLPGDDRIVEYIYRVIDECGNVASATQIVTQSCSPSYVVRKTLTSPATNVVGVGSNLQFQITVTNTGDTAIVPEVTDLYDPTMLSFTTSSPTYTSFSPGIVIWSNLPAISPSGSYSISVEFISLTNGSSTNTALATATTTNGFPLPPQTSNVPFRYMFIGNVFGMNIDNKAVVAWETDGEAGTAGFVLWREDIDGKWVAVSPFIPASGQATRGVVYGYADSGCKPGGSSNYRLVEVENRGTKLNYGPFKVVFPAKLSDTAKLNPDGSLAQSGLQVAAQQHAAIPKNASTAQSVIGVGSVLKAIIASNGLYTVTASQLSTCMGRSVAEIQSLILSRMLTVRNAGVNIPCVYTTNGVSFYGVPEKSIYTDSNVYWIHMASGIVMPVKSVEEASLQANQTTRQKYTVERNMVVRPDLFDDPSSDIWLWQSVSAGSQTSNRFSTGFDAPAVVSGSDAQLVLRIKGAMAGATHAAKISINGKVAGDIHFAGLESVQHEFTVSGLMPNGNKIEVMASGDPLSIFFIDSFDIVYSRPLAASADAIIFDACGEERLTVKGFSKSDVCVYDVTEPLSPCQLSGMAVDGTNGSYCISFVAPNKFGRYLATLAGTSITPASVSPDSVSSLKSSTNDADCVLITSSALKPMAQSLADYRSARKLKTMVVDIQDVFDEFGDGEKSPQAVAAFIAHAAGNWMKAPRYVTLAGSGSLDYRNYLGYGDCSVPPMTVKVQTGLQASDSAYGDIDHDGRVDIPVGRLPATSAQELKNAIAKIKALESGGGNLPKRAIALADNPDAGGNFPQESDVYAVSRMRNMNVSRIYLGSASSPSSSVARAQLLAGLRTGSGLMTYFGHSTENRFAGEQLFTRADVASLGNSSHPPVLIAMTCLMGNFGIPGTLTFGQTLINSSNGAAAVIGSGSKVGPESCRLAEAMLSNIFEKRASRLGDAMLATVNSLSAAALGGLSTTYNLLGDAAMELKSLNVAGNTMSAGSALVNDFDGDGSTDMAVWSPVGGAWDILRSSGQANATVQFGWSANIPVAADYDGDGITDIALFYPAEGNWYIVPSSTGGVITKNWGWWREIPVPADYDGDSKADLAVYDPPTGTWYVSPSSTNKMPVVQWGWSQAIPVPGDYDGDGKADIATYVPASGTWSILQSSDGKARILSWGWSQAIPVPADYDGDKRIDIAVYVPASGTWSILQSRDGAVKQINWGYSLAAPVPGDYDGDGLADIAVYVASTGTWYIKLSLTGAVRQVTWGWSQALPVLPQYQTNKRYFPSP